MSELDRFTSKQQKDLLDNGYRGLYQILTHFPYSLRYITPYTNPKYHKEFETYLLYEDRLVGFFKKTSQRPHWVLTWQSGLKTYYFNTAPFTRGILKEGETFQCLLKKNGDFLSVFRLQQKQTSINQSRFVLGKAESSKTYFIPKYPKTGSLDSSRWLTLHNRIQRSEYILDLTGMIPTSLAIPEHFDIWPIHNPSSLEKFQELLQMWKSFQVFLYMTTYYSWSKKHQQEAPATVQDKKWMREITAKLPYTLSPSQESAIADIMANIST